MKCMTVVFAAALAIVPAAPAAFDWEWMNPLPQGNHLRAACAIGEEFYAVGDAGAAVRFDGSSWSQLPFPWPENLRGIWGNSSSNIYAVGSDPSPYSNGGIYRYDGSAWSLSKTISYYELLSIWGLSSNAIFTGGDGGKIFFFDGSDWLDDSPGMGITYGVNGIWGTSPADLFAVAGPYIMHRDGSAWTTMTRLGSGSLRAVWGSSSRNVFAAGTGARVYHYDGSEWTVSFDEGSGYELCALWGRSAGEVYALGGSYPARAFRYDGVSWQAVTAPARLPIYAAAGPGESGILAVGQNGQILEYGGGWSPVNRFTGHGYKGVWGSSAADVYVVGYDFLSEVPEDKYADLRFDGDSWSAFTLPCSGPYDCHAPSTAVWGSSATDVFIGSENGKIHHFDGTTWSFQTRLSYQEIRGIWGSGSADVFAAGVGNYPFNNIWHYDGTDWRVMTEIADVTFSGLWGSSGENVLAGAYPGRIFRYDGSGWSLMTEVAGPPYRSLKIWGSGADNVYAVDGDLMLRYDGGSWTVVETGLKLKAYSGIWGSGPGDIFVVGGATGFAGKVWGRIYHYDGSSWSDVGPPCVNGLTAVWGSSGQDVYAAGDGGVVLRYRGGRIPPSESRPWIYDYNGDGTSEIAIFRPDCGLWAVRGVTRAYYGTWGDLPSPGDYEGDGTTGFAVFRPATGLWAVRDLTREYFGASGDWPLPADYSGDGTAEIAVFRPGTGLWAVRGLTREYFGAFGDWPLPADYSGDGTAEITVFRPATGLWSTRGVGRAYFGRAGDEPVPAFYDGAGAEPAVFRPAGGLWAILNGPRYYFGAFPDIPQPAHYGGGMTARIGIFRESTGLWAVRDLTRAYFGRIGDIPVTR